MLTSSHVTEAVQGTEGTAGSGAKFHFQRPPLPDSGLLSVKSLLLTSQNRCQMSLRNGVETSFWNLWVTKSDVTSSASEEVKKSMKQLYGAGDSLPPTNPAPSTIRMITRM